MCEHKEMSSLGHGFIVADASKAVREAKRWTSWTSPAEAYEAGVQDFVHALLDPKKTGDFDIVANLAPLQPDPPLDPQKTVSHAILLRPRS